ncbi:tubulin epsilon and delta complex protein 2 [Trichechus manatus latirostris]|uniref:Tubulin epsilon and delta complex protein 2 n=1 Tax=Trichechus manatus latirostris TaxID=127582 RepID=A0A2Y9FYU8_TRIMA|nr:tubulin epsilon and delta complex protein 2 [Trichechus manatus latirostris]
MASSTRLPADCSRRLVAELRGALDACAERQRQLDRSLRVCRRLLRAWEPAGPPAAEPTPGPESNGDPSPACTPSPQDLKELELLTQVLEKAVRVRKGVSKPAERDKAPSLKPRTVATPPATTTSAPPQAPGQAGSRTPETRPPRRIRQSKVLAKGHPERKLLSTREKTSLGRGAQATSPSPGDQQVTPSAAPRAPEAFTLEEKGTLLRLPVAFQKAASQNARLWAQIDSTRTSDSANAATRTRFLQRMQAASGRPNMGLSAAAVEAEVGRLRQACSLLRLRMGAELAAAPAGWVQEYRCLLILEGLQAMAGRCLQRLQELHEAVTEQHLELWPSGMPPRASSLCGGGTDAAWSPQPLLYSSTRELQTLAALRLRVAMLDQQLHLEKVLMVELLPLVRTQGPDCLALFRAVYSLLCNGGQRFPMVLRDEPAD